MDRDSLLRRRESALTRELIVETSIELLDESDAKGLTFRKLAAVLATGPGAIYWHVANKDELMIAATDSVLAEVFEAVRSDATPAEVIRGVALSVFEAIDNHPWLGAQLAYNSWHSTMLRIFDLVGQQLQLAGVKPKDQFFCATALVSFTVGAGSQSAINPGLREEMGSREEQLQAMVDEWTQLPVDEYPFVHDVADEMSNHDDAEQFIAGIDMIMSGAGVDVKAKRRRR